MSQTVDLDVEFTTKEALMISQTDAFSCGAAQLQTVLVQYKHHCASAVVPILF